MTLMCDHLEALARGKCLNLVENVPPGTSKSTIASVLLAPWCWAQLDPALKFIYVSYAEDLSHRFALRSLRLINSDWWRARWSKVEIVGGDQANKSWYDTTVGGLRISTMMGGQATGKHGDILIFDDPHKPDDLAGDVESVKRELDLAWQRIIENAKSIRPREHTLIMLESPDSSAMFFLVDGDRRHLDRTVIGSGKRLDREREILTLLFDDEGEYRVNPLPDPGKAWDYFVRVTFQ